MERSSDTVAVPCADTPNQPLRKQPFHIPVSCALFDKKTGKKWTSSSSSYGASPFSASRCSERKPGRPRRVVVEEASRLPAAKQALTQDRVTLLSVERRRFLEQLAPSQADLPRRAILDEFAGRGAGKRAILGRGRRGRSWRCAHDDKSGRSLHYEHSESQPCPATRASGSSSKRRLRPRPVKLCERCRPSRRRLAKACSTELTEVYASLYCGRSLRCGGGVRRTVGDCET